MVTNKEYFLPPIAIKPLRYPGDIVYKQHLENLGTLAFRSFDLHRDSTMIHQWVNKNYALRYWQLDGPQDRVWETYYDIQRSGEGHSFIGLLNGVPICQFDIYRVLADEIRQFVPAAGPQDCGFHLLMAPNVNPIKGGLSLAGTRAMLDYYFSFPQTQHMYAEPDVTNARSNRILREVGFGAAARAG